MATMHVFKNLGGNLSGEIEHEPYDTIAIHVPLLKAYKHTVNKLRASIKQRIGFLQTVWYISNNKQITERVR